MARFMVKTSEYKNVCKAVNDRKLAELKKEIIEILKKQDEKEFKKAVDLFESQEMHYSHLEKSITGKWVEKAGYGVGTVRIWKGKKYKKIAPGKWARVFDKEGRGTNIAIGKLIAKVNKIDNAEDLLQFVLENKQRFVDENGIDLPILDKLRAAVGIKNENLSGESSSYTYGVGEDVSREKNKIFEGKEKITKEEADLHKVSRKFEQIPTTELKQRKAKLERWIENKTRSKRDSLNNAIFRESYQKELDAINAVLDKRNGKKETSKPDEKKEESEAEKTQNRSNAMKGNQNAKKYGLTDDQIEYYDIQEVVEDVNGYGIVKNSEGKYSYIDDGRVKDRPDDFETSIEKVKERINDTYETKKNIQAAKDYDFKNAKLGSDIEYTKRSDGKHLYFKKSPDGSKVISVTVEVSDMREPLNMTYEVSDTKSGESWQYETAYGNKEGLEWAVEKPEQMEKELKKFFKRDPNKEWEKQNTFEKEPSGLGTFTKVDDKTVEMPADKSSKQLFENLNKSRSSDKTRGFMTECYYDGENIVSTDGLRMTVVKVGDIGLEPGYVSVNTDGGKIRLERDEERTKENRFPNYKAVVSNNESSNQEVKLDNKALSEKLKEMKKEGKYSDNKSPQIALNFEDGKVMLDGVQIGTADGVKFDSDTQRMVVNAKYLKDALTYGDTSKVFVSSDPSKAMVVKTDVSESYVMPLRDNTMEVEYEKKTTKNESETSEKPDEKEILKPEKKSENKEVDSDIERAKDKIKQYAGKKINSNEISDIKILDDGERSGFLTFEFKSGNDKYKMTYDSGFGGEKGSASIKKIESEESDYVQKKRDAKEGYWSDEFKERNMNNIKQKIAAMKEDGASDKKIKAYLEETIETNTNDIPWRERAIEEGRIKGNQANDYRDTIQERTVRIENCKELLKEYETRVEKSLEETFLMDMAVEEEIQKVEEEQEEESLFDDYSAEQPELFNSTAMKVQEAFNRCKVL